MIGKQHRDTRHISLARTLHARLFVNPLGRIFEVGSKVERDQLERTLSRYDCCPSVVKAPSPTELGITSCDGELSPELLHTIGQVLQRWRKELAAEEHRRPAHRRHRIHLHREQAELERLTVRLATLRRWSGELSKGNELPGAPYFLDESAEADLQSLLVEVGRGNSVPEVIAWHARIVYWIAGTCAARRFLVATEGLGLFEKNSGSMVRDEVRSFQKVVQMLKRRSEQERPQHLLAELRQHLRNMTPHAVTKGKLTARFHERTFAEHCDLLISRCAKLLGKMSRFRNSLVPAALAALVAVDGSAVALPVRVLAANSDQETFASLRHNIASLAAQANQPGYDVLLAALGHLEEVQSRVDYGQLRHLLAEGNELADVLWACENDFFYAIHNSCLKLKAVRRLLQTFDGVGIQLDNTDTRQIILCLTKPEYTQIIYKWLNWVGEVSRDAVTPKMQSRLKAVLWDFVVPMLPLKEWIERIIGCLRIPLSRRGNRECSPLLERIREYQQMSGRHANLPKTLRKLIHGAETRQQELIHLQDRQAAGLLNENARRRMEYLEQTENRPLNQSKLYRAAEEAYLHLGIEVMRNIAQEIAETTCAAFLGDVLRSVASRQYLKFALWIDKMDEPDQHRLRILVETRSSLGHEYKRYLPENEAWISQAATHGLNLEHWFSAEIHKENIGDMAVDIEVTSELHHIFLMGTYFGSCLSLGDSNEMSVLANATDANKQVVFMFSRGSRGERRVLARQLIAISSDFELVRYSCYCTHEDGEKLAFDDVQNAIAAYCGRLAAACGMKLANQGSPKLIADHFWYDDGEIEWPAAAEVAFTAISTATEELEVTTC